jgi:hypothetical protein
MMAATAAVRRTAAIISAATAVAASTIAAMATMTSNGSVVGTHQGNTDDGEKHRHAQKNDSIHFCIPPFDSLVGVDHLRSCRPRISPPTPASSRRRSRFFPPIVSLLLLGKVSLSNFAD